MKTPAFPRSLRAAVRVVALCILPAVAGAQAPAYPVAHINATAQPTLTAVGDALFFDADDGLHGDELWTSDGTAAGTRMVADLQPGGASSLPSRPHLTAVGARLYFVADAGDGQALWTTDGTAAGTVRLTLGADSAPDWLTDVGGTLFFSAADDGGGEDLWSSDGTAAGTRRVYDLPAAGLWNAPVNLTALGADLYFTVGSVLWRSDGRGEGTAPVRDLGEFIPSQLSEVRFSLAVRDTTLFIFALPPDWSDGPQRMDLWRSDGTADGTELVTSIEGGLYAATFQVLDDTLFFATYAQAWTLVRPVALWRTDGTATGTRQIASIPRGGAAATLAGSLFFGAASGDGDGIFRTDVDGGEVELLVAMRHVWRLRNADRHLLFVGCTDGGTCGIWESDGTLAGTRKAARADSYSPLTVAGNLAYFTASDEESGRALWALPLDALGRCGNGTVDVGEDCDAGGESTDCDRDCSQSACGDGLRNGGAGETCDDGNQNDDDCCSATCGVAAAGHPCADDDLCDGAEVCDGTGACAAGPPLVCDDLDPNTIDACLASSGCRYTPVPCIGDCDGDRVVDVAELLAMVRSLLHGVPRTCATSDRSRDGQVAIHEVIAAIAHALGGCPGA